MMDFIGKLHPLILHLPIGIFLYVFTHWTYELWLAKKDRWTDFTVALLLGTLGAVASAISGWLLAGEGGYDESLLMWHQNLGIGTAIGAVVLLWGYRKGWSDRVFTGYFAVFTLLIGATGHYGGSLTHGEGFLTTRQEEKVRPVVGNPQEAHIFQAIVLPIMEEKCVSCHNPQKSKGDLLLNDLAGWQQGGENGAVLRMGAAAESRIIRRVFLPKEDEAHMPPAGKLQLTNEERNFLKWWIDEMENYDHRIKDLEVTPEIQAYLESLQARPPITVDRPSLQQLEALRAYGLIAELAAADLPWVTVRLVQADSFQASNLRRLKRVAPAIKTIDLSHAGLTDEDVSFLKRLENVETINLSHTPVKSSAIVALEELAHLRSLNLYGTQLDSTVFTSLSSMSALRKVYLWQTAITEDQATHWEAAHPKVEVIAGVDFEQFGSPILVAPTITAEQDLFTDSLLVTLETKATRAVIKYTVDGSTPGEDAAVYTAPFPIYETTEVNAMLTLAGWTDSAPEARTFAKSRFPIVRLDLSISPNEKYYAQGTETLFDLQKGTNAFSDGSWLGFSRDDVTLVADLGQTEMITGVTIGTLSDFNSYIHLPKTIEVSTSVDGHRYEFFERKNIILPETATAAQVHNHLLRAEQVPARYLRIKLENQGVNPPWHPAPGADCWLFVDEVLVE